MGSVLGKSPSGPMGSPCVPPAYFQHGSSPSQGPEGPPLGRVRALGADSHTNLCCFLLGMGRTWGRVRGGWVWARNGSSGVILCPGAFAG